MKLDRYRSPEETPAFPLTAMIDVLFLMIIFLVLGANFDAMVTVELPEARGSLPESGILTVEIHPDSTLEFQGNRYTPAQALEVLGSLRATQLVILPDRRLPVGALFQWYERLSGGLSIPVRVGVRQPDPR